MLKDQTFNITFDIKSVEYKEIKSSYKRRSPWPLIFGPVYFGTVIPGFLNENEQEGTVEVSFIVVSS